MIPKKAVSDSISVKGGKRRVLSSLQVWSSSFNVIRKKHFRVF